MDDIKATAETASGAVAPAGGAVAPAAGAAVSVRPTGLAMKRRGPVAVWLGLPLVTLGIYQLVWYYKIHKELQEFDRRRVLNPTGSLLVMIFLGWTLIAPLISFHNTGKAIADAQRAAGLPVTCSPAASTFLAFVFGLNTWYMQRQLNLVVAAYGDTAPGTEIARIFGVPPHLISDATNSTSWGSGLAEQNQAFAMFSLRPWLERIEAGFTRL
ncbi:DUF4234 domain-containing protein, partial [Streptomyces anandii]|uniref:DUF4234 domain-containing protein n=1 Tax=Streptomyces anandii TaxID=285454 RepID=UPI0036C33712